MSRAAHLLAFLRLHTSLVQPGSVTFQTLGLEDSDRRAIASTAEALLPFEGEGDLQKREEVIRCWFNSQGEVD